MLNQVVMVGRVSKFENKILTVKIIDKDNKDAYANINVLSQNLLNNFQEYCTIDDIIGIKGFISNNENGEMIIVAEKITFLTNKKQEENED